MVQTPLLQLLQHWAKCSVHNIHMIWKANSESCWKYNFLKYLQSKSNCTDTYPRTPGVSLFRSFASNRRDWFNSPPCLPNVHVCLPLAGLMLGPMSGVWPSVSFANDCDKLSVIYGMWYGQWSQTSHLESELLAFWTEKVLGPIQKQHWIFLLCKQQEKWEPKWPQSYLTSLSPFTKMFSKSFMWTPERQREWSQHRQMERVSSCLLGWLGS